jgi:hypothetical protein
VAMGTPIDDLSEATMAVLASFRSALNSLDDATHQHQEAARLLSEEVRTKTGGGDADGGDAGVARSDHSIRGST